MSNVVPFDTLALAQALRDEAGYDQKQAEGTAKVFARLLVVDLVTKDDFKAGMAVARADLEATKVELEARIESTVSAAKVDIIKWMFGTIAAQTALLIAAVKLLH